ncbi:organic solvent tolerance protein OstA [Chitinispirillum alkaliphilum]|nr:organic solvent tolerance protein OstA [Chitinispirillum alkaliphilum]
MRICFSDKKRALFPKLKTVLCFLMISATIQRGFSEDSQILILQSADSNENHFSGGEFVSILRGNVVFTYGDLKISSSEARWWRNRGTVNFNRNVRVERPSQLITCDRMNFTRDENTLKASGNFFFYDTLEQTTLRGQHAEYNLETSEFSITGNPVLERVDTLNSDTLIITGKSMDYRDRERAAGVRGEVNIAKGPLSARAGSADFFSQSNSVRLELEPQIHYETHVVEGDIAEIFFAGEELQKAKVMGNAFVVYTEYSPRNSDTTLTNIWSDTLVLSTAESGNLDTLFAFGNVVTRYFEQNDTLHVNEATGREMVLSFDQGGVLENAVIRGNARSIYYIEDSDGKGYNKASGDSIVVFFEEGRTRRIRLSGGTRGVYYSQ